MLKIKYISLYLGRYRFDSIFSSSHSPFIRTHLNLTSIGARTIIMSCNDINNQWVLLDNHDVNNISITLLINSKSLEKCTSIKHYYKYIFVYIIIYIGYLQLYTVL